MKRLKSIAVIGVALAAFLVARGIADAAIVYSKSTNAHVRIVSEAPGVVSYSATIQPIFNMYCTSCHGVTAGVTLTSYSATIASGVVTPGNAANSALYNAVSGSSDNNMPPTGSLSSAQVSAIQNWINQGAQNN